MCGRYAIYAAPHKLKDMFGLDTTPNLPPRYNAAPMQDLPVIVKGHIGMARWGLLPPWAKEDDAGLCSKMINARSETVAEKASFRESWARGRRCLIPANGFYEWKKSQDGKIKQPYFIFNPDAEIVAFAGLWAKTHDVLSFTILTKDADGPVADIHHRTPVMFDAAQASGWFAANHNDAMAMVRAATSKHMAFHPVAKAVGKVANDDESLIAEAAPIATTSNPSQASLL